MKRRLSSGLDAWLREPRRKPLVLRGARQVGKSYLVRTWGAAACGAVVELNFERDPRAAACFSDNDPRATMRRIETHTRRALAADGGTLLFLDEIQAAPELIAKLRWFAEEAPGLPVIAAGSLLDLALRAPAAGVPVGRISYMHVEPMGFEEFLEALGEERLAETLRTEVTGQAIADGTAWRPEIADRLADLFRQYVLVGGMPEAVERYRNTQSLLAVAEVHQALLATYRDDFARYAGRVPHHRLAAVLDAVPRQLGGKFRFANVDRDERSAALRAALDLLAGARVCHKVPSTSGEGVPLGAGADRRDAKVLFVDVGLVSAALGLSLGELERTRDVVLAHRGALAEQVAGQLLRLTFPPFQEPGLHYWRREERGAAAEVDYLVQHGSSVLPVEVKSGAAGGLRSLHVFMALRKLDRAVRIWSGPPSLTPVDVNTTTGVPVRYQLVSLPLGLAEQLPRLLTEIADLGGQSARRARKP